MIFIFLAIFGGLVWLDRFYTRRERGLKRLEHELWQLDARERRLCSEGWIPIDDYGLPDAASTADFLRAVDGIKTHSVHGMQSGNHKSWDWLKSANHFTHWRYSELMP